MARRNQRTSSATPEPQPEQDPVEVTESSDDAPLDEAVADVEEVAVGDEAPVDTPDEAVADADDAAKVEPQEQVQPEEPALTAYERDLQRGYTGTLPN